MVRTKIERKFKNWDILAQKYPNNIPILAGFMYIHMKKYALYTRKLGVCGGCWLFGSNLVLSANVMKLGASRRAFSFEGRQELAPVKAFKCKKPHGLRP